MLRLTLLLVVVSFASTKGDNPDENQHDSLIDFPVILYVKPGDDFSLACDSPHGSSATIYTPKQTVPDSDQLDGWAENESRDADDLTIMRNFKDADKEEHAGTYTCILFHGPNTVHGQPRYSVRRCVVIIKDPCEENGCGEYEKCVADMTDGSHTCTCDLECNLSVMDFLCTDTCEFFATECLMRQAMCKDGKKRERESSWFCPNPMKPPDVAAVDDVTEVLVEDGESITLSAGIINEGTPVSKVRWTFYPDDGEIVELAASDNEYELTVDSSKTGVYLAEVVHCAKSISVLRYEVSIEDLTELPPTIGPEDNEGGAYHICSMFPGGAIENFQGEGVWYDMSCSHVLGADVMPGGDYSNAWYIYGSFDQHDGDTALRAMTFYVGRNAFEFQRGWLINVRGRKFPVKENEITEIPNTGCSVEFRDLHLKLDCPFFQAYYDGIMSGHIRLKLTHTYGGMDFEDSISFMPYENTRWNLGLCFDTNFGRRTNWQVSRPSSRCDMVSEEDKSCTEPPPDTCQKYTRAVDSIGSWSECAAGPVKSCNEIQCGGEVATPAQLCALQQAARVMCDLKTYGMVLPGSSDEDCPVDECEWKMDLVGRGCPQDELPFVC